MNALSSGIFGPPAAGGVLLLAMLSSACGHPEQTAARVVAPPMVGRSWNFERVPPGQLPEGWKVDATHPQQQLALWRVAEDPSAPSGDHVLALAEVPVIVSNSFNLCWTGRVRFLDGRISVRFKARGGEEDQGGGVVWRVVDRNNYFIARFNPLEDNFRVYTVKDGERRTLASAKVSLADGPWHLLELSQEDDYWRVPSS